MDSLPPSTAATSGAFPAFTPAGAGELPAGQPNELLDLLPWGVLALAPAGTVTYLNAAAAALWGVPAAAIVGLAPAQVQPAVLPAELLGALAQPETLPADYWLPHTQQWVALRTAPAPDGQRWVFWDNVTARHQAEADRQRSHKLLLDMEAVAHTGSYAADLRSGSFYFSDGLYRLFGEAPQAFAVTPETIDARSHPDDVATVRQVLDEAVRTRQPYSYRRRIRRADGEWRTMEAHGEVRTNEAGQPVQLLGLVQDVTERVRAEQALHESRALLRATIDSSLDMVQVFEAVRDEQGAVIDFAWVLNNAASERYYGDVIGQRLCQLNPGVVEAGIFDTFKQVLATGVPDQREHHYVHEQFDGWFHQSTVKLGDGVTTTTHDITARKQAEQELRETKELLQATLDSSHYVVQVFKAVRDADGKIVDFTWLLTNQVWEKQYGGPMAGKSLLQENPGVVETGLFELFVQVTETGVPVDHEQYYAHEQFNAWFHQTLVRMGDGFVMNTIDITERKQAELALQESKNLIQTVFDVSLNPIAYHQAVRDASGRIVDFEFRLQNQQARRYAAADQVGKRYSEAYPGILDTAVFKLYSEVVETGHPLDTEVQLTLKGTPYWFHLLAAKLGDGLVASAVDVTERKQAQEELISLQEQLAQQALDRYHSLFHTMEEGVSILEMLYDDHGQPVDMRWVEVNPAFERITGLTDVAGKRTSTFVPTEQYWLDAYDSVVKTGKALRYENYHAGIQQWYRTHTSRIGGPESRIVANVFEDITEHKRHEARLRQAAEAETFRLQLADALGPLADPVAIQEAATRLARQHFAADRCYYCEIAGGQAIIRRDAAAEGLPSVAGTYPLADFALLQAVIEAGRPFIVRDVRQEESVDENLRQLCVQLQVISYLDVPVIKDGQPVGVLCLVQSTPREWTAAEAALAAEVAERAWTAVERAHAEEALRAGEQRLRLVTDATPALIAYVDARLRYRFINQRYQEWFGRAPQELRGQPVREVVGEEAFARLLPHAQAALAGQRQSFEDKLTFRTAGPRHVQTEFVPDVQPDGSVAGYYSLVIDITERKHHEQRQAFLLQFSDALRAEPTADAVASRALALLSEELGLDRCYIAEYHLAADHADIPHQVGNDRVPPLPAGGIRLSDFPEAFRVVFDRTLVIDDFAATEGLSGTDRRNLGALGLRALVIATLRRGEQRPHWAIVAVAAAPRHWTPAEVALLEEATERTWAALERTRAEAALAASEEKYRTLFDTMAEGFTVCRVTRGPAGQVLDLRYQELNRALEQQTGLSRHTLLGRRLSEVLPPADMARWLPRYAAVSHRGEPATFEEYSALLNRWFAVSVYPRRHDELAIFYHDISERKRREQEQAFLLKLSDALRPLTSPADIRATAAELLGQHLGVDRAHYGELNYDTQEYLVARDWHQPGAPSHARRYPLGDWPMPWLLDGHPWVCHDVATDPALPEAQRAAYRGHDICAAVVVPLLKQGRLAATLVVSQNAPHAWTRQEVGLVEETAARTWAAVERAHAAAALAASEQRLRALIMNLPGAAAFVVGSDLRYQLAGGEALDAAGLAPTDLVGRTVAEAMPPELVPQYEARYRQALAGQHFSLEHTAHGRAFISRGVPLLDLAGQPEAVLVVSYDITARKQAEEALRQAEERYRQQLEEQVARRTRELQASRDLLQSVFDTSLISMSVLYAVRDEAGQVLDFRIGLVNKELERETGRTDLVSRLYTEEYPGIRQVGIFDLMLRTLATGQPQGMEYFYEHEGFKHWFACQFVKMGDGLVATNLDITERKTAEQERLRNLRLLEQAEAMAGLGSWDYDLATRVMRWSEGMYQLVELPLGQPVSPDIYLRFVVADDRPRAEQLVRQLTAGKSVEETLRLRVGEQIKTVRLKAVVLRDEASRPLRVLGVDLDISELQRLEADNLRLRLTQQQALFEAVQEAQEAERKRIAEGLHNGIGQILYATKLRLDRLHAPLLGTHPDLVAARREADQLLGEAIRQTRALSHELVPTTLQEFGLEAALQDICRKMSTPQLRLHCQVALDADAAPLPPALQMALYRIAQELAQNIAKHAHGASEASLELETMPGWAMLRAEDNGPGFAPTAPASPGLGLRSIRDRVALLGGRLELGSAATGGAYVRIRIPLPAPAL